MEEQEVDVVEIEDKEFYIVDNIESYSYLSEINNPSNIIVLKDDGEFLSSPENEEEVENALNLYNQKHK